jgi:hypothetical protein
MNADTGALQRLQEARDLPAVLAAAYDAFEHMLTAIRAYQDRVDGLFAAFAMSAASAADGRDAVAFAPSFTAPAQRRTPAPAGILRGGRDAGHVADALAELSQLLAVRLVAAAGSAQDSGDVTACRHAAGHAQSIDALLRGSGP